MDLADVSRLIEPLAVDVIRNAVNAAISDTRFTPVRAQELPKISLSISVLDVPRPVDGLAADTPAKRLGETAPRASRPTGRSTSRRSSPDMC